MGNLWLDVYQPRKAGLVRGQEKGLHDLVRSLPALCFCTPTIPAGGFGEY